MGSVQIKEDCYEISFAGKTLVLLPKEFALFQFLYHHQNQVFSREALLDRVWPLEEPVDRTVDDHVYRLRKKLKEWEPFLIIETVRGIGYRLHFVAEQEKITPSLQDENFQLHFNQLLTKYHLFGQGEALQTLAAQQKILGAKIDPFYEMYTELVKGNWAVLLNETTIPFWERAYFMIVLYGLLEDDPHKGKSLITTVLTKNQLPLSRQWELQAIDLPFLHIWCGEYDRALTRLNWASKKAVDHQLEGFKLAIQIQHIFPLSMMGKGDQAQHQLADAEKLLQGKPYLRELSYFHISKGLCCIQYDDLKSGKELVSTGVEMMKQTKFELQYLHVLTHLSHTLPQLLGDSHSLVKHYRGIRNDLIEKNNGDQVKNRFLPFFL